MSTEPRPSASLPVERLTRAPADSSASTWSGTSVMLRHNPDETVTATSRGTLVTAATEWAALKELARPIKAAGLARAPSGIIKTVARPVG